MNIEFRDVHHKGKHRGTAVPFNRDGPAFKPDLSAVFVDARPLVPASGVFLGQGLDELHMRAALFLDQHFRTGLM